MGFRTLFCSIPSSWIVGLPKSCRHRWEDWYLVVRLHVVCHNVRTVFSLSGHQVFSIICLCIITKRISHIEWCIFQVWWVSFWICTRRIRWELTTCYRKRPSKVASRSQSTLPRCTSPVCKMDVAVPSYGPASDWRYHNSCGKVGLKVFWLKKLQGRIIVGWWNELYGAPF